MQKKYILVIGMHRSGTSLIAQILNECNVYFGENTLGKSSANPYGHMEDKRILNYNEKILEAGGGSWDAPPTKEKISKNWHRVEKSIKQYIDSELGKNHNTIGIKDPRISLMIEEYSNLLKGCRIIYVKRDHAEVASSINFRNKINIIYGKKLSEYYNNQIASSLDKIDNKVLIIDYNDLRKNNEGSIEPLSEILKFLEISHSQKIITKLRSKIIRKKKIKKDAKKIKKTALYFKAIKMPHLAAKYIISSIRRFFLRRKWDV